MPIRRIALWRRDMVSAAQTTPVYLDELYTYDGMYQLTSLQRGRLNATEDALVANTKTFAEQWTLDPLGNWTDFKQDTDTDAAWELDQARTHNKANEIAGIDGASTLVAYDKAGNMTTAPKPDVWNDHYHLVYDAWNRLVEVKTPNEQNPVAIYEYDGLNRRIVRWSYDQEFPELPLMNDCRHYYYSDRWQVLEERLDMRAFLESINNPIAGGIGGCIGYSGADYYISSGISGCDIPQNFVVDRQFVWGLRYVDDLILRDRGVNSVRIYALQDPNWNVVALADTAGAILERYRYSAYGVPTSLTSTFGARSSTSYDWETLYCGYRYDLNTGVYQVRNRYYHAALGRFINRDPIEYKGGINLYEYCSDRPTERTDPAGTKCSCHCQFWISIWGGILGWTNTHDAWYTAIDEGAPSQVCEKTCASYAYGYSYEWLGVENPDQPGPDPMNWPSGYVECIMSGPIGEQGGLYSCVSFCKGAYKDKTFRNMYWIWPAQGATFATSCREFDGVMEINEIRERVRRYYHDDRCEVA